MDAFEKVPSQSRIEKLAKFDLYAIELLDDNQIKVLNSEGKPIDRYNKYTLFLNISFGKHRCLIGKEEYFFGIKEAILEIRCAGCKIPWNTWELRQKLEISIQINEGVSSSNTTQLSTRASGFTETTASTSGKTNIKYQALMEGTDLAIDINFNARRVDERILSGDLKDQKIGILEVGDREIELKATLKSVEIVVTDFNDRDIKSPTLARLILGYHHKITEIKNELIGELQNVELRSTRRPRIKVVE
jgi:hypothetical protein